MSRSDCSWSRVVLVNHVITEAFRQAFAESGLLPHPGGKCPVPDCRCSELVDAIAERAEELAAERLGIPLSELR
jgi:hypothetical protein